MPAINYADFFPRTSDIVHTVILEAWELQTKCKGCIIRHSCASHTWIPWNQDWYQACWSNHVLLLAPFFLVRKCILPATYQCHQNMPVLDWFVPSKSVQLLRKSRLIHDMSGEIFRYSTFVWFPSPQSSTWPLLQRNWSREETVCIVGFLQQALVYAQWYC